MDPGGADLDPDPTIAKKNRIQARPNKYNPYQYEKSRSFLVILLVIDQLCLVN